MGWEREILCQQPPNRNRATNFEWRRGFRQKFGLIATEPNTLNRIPKPSAHMFHEIARANAILPETLERYLESDR